METIPTAERFLYAKLMLSNQPYLKGKQYEKAMIEFAKLHVAAALKQASTKANLKEECSGVTNRYYQKEILNAYSLDNIK